MPVFVLPNMDNIRRLFWGRQLSLSLLPSAQVPFLLLLPTRLVASVGNSEDQAEKGKQQVWREDLAQRRCEQGFTSKP